MANINGITERVHITVLSDESRNTTNEFCPGMYGKSRAAGVVADKEFWHRGTVLIKSALGEADVYGKVFSGNFDFIGNSNTWVKIKRRGETRPCVLGRNYGSGVCGVTKKWVRVYGETESIENEPEGVWGKHKAPCI